MDEVVLMQELTHIADRSKSNTHRIDDLERRQSELEDLVATVRVLANRLETVESDAREIKQDVKSLKLIPAKRWESVVEKIIMVGVGAIISMVLMKAGIVL